MELQEIIERNYQAAVKRGKITNKTDCSHFATDIRNEVTELEMSLSISKINPFDVSELADIILVSFSMARHFGYDIEKELSEKTLYNEIRKD